MLHLYKTLFTLALVGSCSSSFGMMSVKAKSQTALHHTYEDGVRADQVHIASFNTFPSVVEPLVSSAPSNSTAHDKPWTVQDQKTLQVLLTVYANDWEKASEFMGISAQKLQKEYKNFNVMKKLRKSSGDFRVSLKSFRKCTECDYTLPSYKSLQRKEKWNNAFYH